MYERSTSHERLNLYTTLDIKDKGRHLSVRVREHLHSKVRSAVGKHIDNCYVCKEKPVGVNDFKIMRVCSLVLNITPKFRKLC